MLGYDSPEELIAAARDLDHGFYVDPGMRREMRRVLDKDGELSGLEVQVRRKDGTPIWVLMNLSAVRDAAGKTLHYDGMIQDITPRKKTEDELREVSGLLLQSQNQERRRIARELHDSTAQSLAALAMNLSLIGKAATALDAKTRKRLSESLQLAQQSCREIRNLSYLLHPPELQDTDLWSAVRWYVEGFSSRSGIRVDLSVPKSAKDERIPGDVEVTLFRIVQESLANIHRHSGSRRARIRIARGPSRVTLVVRDDGRGLRNATGRRPGAPALMGVGIAGMRLGRSKSGVSLVVRDQGRGLRAATSRGAGRGMLLGVGIAGMRERVRQLGGRIEIDSDGRGTCVKVTVPVPRGN